MSFETLLDRNKSFAATNAVAKNPQIPFIPHQLSYIITCIDPRTDPSQDPCSLVLCRTDGIQSGKRSTC